MRKTPDDPCVTIGALQAQLDAFTAYYNTQRPHRAIGRRTPQTAWNARPRALPTRQGIRISEHFRVRRDRVDTDGKLTLRHSSRLHHIGTGRRWAGTKVLILAHDLDIRIITQDDGELIRESTLDPTRDYQPRTRGCELRPETTAHDVSRQDTGALGGTRTPSLLIRSRIPAVQPVRPRPSGQLRSGAQSRPYAPVQPVSRSSVAGQ
jgi:Integrase core domain